MTHDQGEALGLSDRIAVMHAGRIEQLGPPREIYERPATRFVADFIGASTVMRGRAIASDRVELAPDVSLKVSISPAPAAGQEVELAIRPERVSIVVVPGDNVVTARIVGVTYQGLQTEVTAEIVGGQRLLAFVPEPAPPGLVPGRTLLLHLPAEAFMSLTPRAATASGQRG